MEHKLITVIVLLIPLLVMISIAVGASLSYWSGTDRLSKFVKKTITASATFIILIMIVYLARLSGINGGDLIDNPDPDTTSVSSS